MWSWRASPNKKDILETLYPLLLNLFVVLQEVMDMVAVHGQLSSNTSRLRDAFAYFCAFSMTQLLCSSPAWNCPFNNKEQPNLGPSCSCCQLCIQLPHMSDGHAGLVHLLSLLCALASPRLHRCVLDNKEMFQTNACTT